MKTRAVREPPAWLMFWKLKESQRIENPFRVEVLSF